MKLFWNLVVVLFVILSVVVTLPFGDPKAFSIMGYAALSPATPIPTVLLLVVAWLLYIHANHPNRTR